MGSYTEHRGQLDGAGARIGVVAGRFNDHVTKPLLEGCLDALEAYGVASEDVSVWWAPGSFELPLVAKQLAGTGVDAVICLGAVIRGDTAHFEYVAGECAAGCMRAMLETGVPIVFGVLTTDNVEQAMARAGGEHGHKGREAAATALAMRSLLNEIGEGS